jgi:hypothetical protein
MNKIDIKDPQVQLLISSTIEFLKDLKKVLERVQKVKENK